MVPFGMSDLGELEAPGRSLVVVLAQNEEEVGHGPSPPCFVFFLCA
jgi:hypothetical protein